MQYILPGTTKINRGLSPGTPHPITGAVSPHLGLDLAAPMGTPVPVAAGGEIIKGLTPNKILLATFLSPREAA